MRITNEQPRGAERRRLLRAGVAAVTALTLPSLAGLARAARADTLRLLCSGPGGSIPDLIVRSVGEQLAGVQGRRVVVDNKPGAAGQISVGALKSAPADGSTLLLAQGAIATVFPTSTRVSATTPRSISNPCRWRARCRSRWPSALRCLPR